MTSLADKELLGVLAKLYTIQEDVGAKAKTTTEEKIQKAVMGTQGSAKTAKKGARFLELKSSIVDRLKKAHALLEEEDNRKRRNLKSAGATSSAIGGRDTGNLVKDVIARRAQVREEIRQASEEWTELEGLYKNEARKKRSKFTREELEIQQTLVQRLRVEIDRMTAALQQSQQQYHATGRGERDDVLASTANMQAMSAVDVGRFSKNTWAASGGGFGDFTAHDNGIEVTDVQRSQIQQLYDRDADFDKQLDLLSEGLKDLSEVAMMQQEEVKRQNVMLDNVEQKIDDVHEHLNNVNFKMKETLNQIRGADKICVDVLCILLMVGLGAVLYLMVKNQITK
jgi:hypothetical protein